MSPSPHQVGLFSYKLGLSPPPYNESVPYKVSLSPPPLNTWVCSPIKWVYPQSTVFVMGPYPHKVGLFSCELGLPPPPYDESVPFKVGLPPPYMDLLPNKGSAPPPPPAPIHLIGSSIQWALSLYLGSVPLYSGSVPL